MYRLRVPGTSGRETLMTGPEVTYTNGSTSIYNDSNRYQIVMNAPYYPHLYLNAYARNGNTTHGAVFTMMGGLNSGGYRKWNIGIANTNPNELSIGWYDNNQNPHYGVGVGWSYPARWWIDTGGNSIATGSHRAPIFYDNNNTGYYWHGDGYSNAYQQNFTGRVWYSDYLVSRNQGGLMGDYNASGTRSKVIWTIGESWPIGNMYGLAYEYNGTWGHHLALKNNGGTYHRISFASQGADFSGNVYAGSSFRSPIFYDNNNTGYYFDGASGNSTRFEGVSNRTMAWMGLPGHTRNSGEYYRARPRQTGDTNYWTGAYGWGRQDMNVVSTWGSGFIDSWSNPPNQPSGTSHWVGMQAFHYRSSNTGGYGWQMVGGPISNLRFRSSWSGWRSWRTIPVLDENNGNGGAMYAGIYYDSNSTGYYCNPASTSQLRYVLANDWFRAQGSTGFYFQDRGYGMRSVGDEGGQYGTVSTYGSINGWEGWSMNGRSLLMHNNSSSTGLYNDVNNEWLCEGIHNSHFYIYYNGGWKARTESWGLRINDDLRAEGNVIAYYSDMRLKDKEGDIENALDKVGKLNGFYYRNNKEANMIGYKGNDLQVGVSAQDVKSVLPEIVHNAPLAERLGYDYMTVDYDRLTPLLVNAINEQNDIVKSQKEEIEYLKSELSELKEMMKELLKK